MRLIWTVTRFSITKWLRRIGSSVSGFPHIFPGEICLARLVLQAIFSTTQLKHSTSQCEPSQNRAAMKKMVVKESFYCMEKTVIAKWITQNFIRRGLNDPLFRNPMISLTKTREQEMERVKIIRTVFTSFLWKKEQGAGFCPLRSGPIVRAGRRFSLPCVFCLSGE